LFSKGNINWLKCGIFTRERVYIYICVNISKEKKPYLKVVYIFILKQQDIKSKFILAFCNQFKVFYK